MSDSEDPKPIYLRASLSDIHAVDMNMPVIALCSADFRDFEQSYNKARETYPESSAEYRVYSMIGAICSFGFRQTNSLNPYSACVEWEGRRTAIPNDFRDMPIEVLEGCLSKISNCLLISRIADLIWLLDRSKYQVGQSAAKALIQTLNTLKQGTLLRRSKVQSHLDYNSIQLFSRAAFLSEKLNHPSEIREPLLKWLETAKYDALSLSNYYAVQLLNECDLDRRLSAPECVAMQLQSVAKEVPDPINRKDLWQLAARAFHLAKKEEEKWNCVVKSAYCLVDHAGFQATSFQQAHWIRDAIDILHGVPNVKEQRAELRARLLEIQPRIIEDMQTHIFSFQPDADQLRDIENLREKIQSLPFSEKIYWLASSYNSEPVEKLKDEARNMNARYPLQAMFGATHHDKNGRVTHRSNGSPFGDEDNEAQLLQQISLSLNIKRTYTVQTLLLPLIDALKEEIEPRQWLHRVCHFSPFVPADRVSTYIKGIEAFLDEDLIASVSILVPQLENSIRYVLLQKGHEVTSHAEGGVQEEKPLTSIMENMGSELTEIFGADITFEIEHLFIKKSGPNLRNLVAHGLLNDQEMNSVDALYACWFIFSMVCRPMLGDWKKVTGNI